MKKLIGWILAILLVFYIGTHPGPAADIAQGIGNTAADLAQGIGVFVSDLAS
ncbi:hypothetical protein EV385_0012 [Krasilnikovia cinnamomea]|uniref:Uncharacterized protein n=1 Tax=Krasilnikovia cinnamomea TaxID=349313 RepID=A0A4Q7ZEC8_9ACTN|nr:hypothetical protein [Krasilnikovia cinnamomea]RZU48299.1 hypothetical protein EV385_0012 [Krasilnikovia cinnamomea]